MFVNDYFKKLFFCFFIVNYKFTNNSDTAADPPLKPHLSMEGDRKMPAQSAVNSIEPDSEGKLNSNAGGPIGHLWMARVRWPAPKTVTLHQ